MRGNRNFNWGYDFSGPPVLILYCGHSKTQKTSKSKNSLQADNNNINEPEQIIKNIE